MRTLISLSSGLLGIAALFSATLAQAVDLPPPQQPAYNQIQNYNTAPQQAQPAYAPPQPQAYGAQYYPQQYQGQTGQPAYPSQAYQHGGTPLFRPAVPPGTYVTQEQFKTLLKIFKRVVDRFDALEKRMAAAEKAGGGKGKGKGGAAQTNSDAVDLDNLDTSTTAAAGGVGGAPAGMGQSSAHGGQAGAPVFKVYFDLNLVNRPGVGPNAFTFTNFHGLLLFEMIPTPDLQFSFDLGLGSAPRFYELDYQINRRLQIRVGKIWIPFDDMAPHNIFGGRVNVSKLSPGGSNLGAFLPDIWADHGVGLKYTLADTRAIAADFHLYVTNGFRQGGTDPKPSSTNPYPDFSDTGLSTEDNNRDKAIGSRFAAKFGGGLFGAGVSYYTAQWTTDTVNNDSTGRVSILGLDAQLRLPRTELRTGMASMGVSFPSNETFSRTGFYGELSQKFGAQQNWKFLLRGGTISLDSRLLDTSDQTIVGATILYRPNVIEYSLSHSRDLKDNALKNNHSYTIARVIVAL